MRIACMRSNLELGTRVVYIGLRFSTAGWPYKLNIYI